MIVRREHFLSISSAGNQETLRLTNIQQMREAHPQDFSVYWRVRYGGLAIGMIDMREGAHIVFSQL